MFSSFTKREIRHFHVVVVHWRQDMNKKAWCTYKVAMLPPLNLMLMLILMLMLEMKGWKNRKLQLWNNESLFIRSWVTISLLLGDNIDFAGHEWEVVFLLYQHHFPCVFNEKDQRIKGARSPKVWTGRPDRSFGKWNGLFLKSFRWKTHMKLMHI